MFDIFFILFLLWSNNSCPPELFYLYSIEKEKRFGIFWMFNYFAVKGSHICDNQIGLQSVWSLLGTLKNWVTSSLCVSENYQRKRETREKNRERFGKESDWDKVGKRGERGRKRAERIEFIHSPNSYKEKDISLFSYY